MSRLASQADFFATYDLDGNKVPGTGTLYDNYQRYPFFAERANILAARYPVNLGKCVVLGCGFGYLVDELVQRGYDCWGVEAADYARNKAAEVLPFASANRVVLANVANRSALNAVKTAAGLNAANGRFAWGVTEDLLPTCTDEAEVQLGLAEVRRMISTTAGRFAHIITCTKPSDPSDLDRRLPGLLWRSRAQWRAIIGAVDFCLDAEGNVEF